MKDTSYITDEIQVVLDRAREMADSVGITGYGVAVVTGPDGEIKQVEPFVNLVTDIGDSYYASKAITGIGPAAPAAPTPMNGMKLGTGTTAAAKSGAGAALVTYKAGSNAAFNTGYAQKEDLGAGLGDNAVYQCVYAAGVATDAALTEVVTVNDSGADATSTAANTYSRGLFASAINKGAGDALTVTWKHKFLGA